MQKIGASILGKENKVELVNSLIDQGVEMIHYDVMDGEFVEAISLPMNEIKEIVKMSKTHIVDIHLMTVNPIEQIKEIHEIADFITFHFEATGLEKAKEILSEFKGNIGIAINPSTDISLIKELLDKVSHVLVMSVIPGKGGQTFIGESLNKISQLKEQIIEENLNVEIQVDGGINYEWGPKAFSAGVDSVVSGSFLINMINDKDFFKRIQKKN